MREFTLFQRWRISIITYMHQFFMKFRANFLNSSSKCICRDDFVLLSRILFLFEYPECLQHSNQNKHCSHSIYRLICIHWMNFNLSLTSETLLSSDQLVRNTCKKFCMTFSFAILFKIKHIVTATLLNSPSKSIVVALFIRIWSQLFQFLLGKQQKNNIVVNFIDLLLTKTI